MLDRTAVGAAALAGHVVAKNGWWEPMRSRS